MKYIKELTNMANTCVAYGNFDSVHRGHQKVLSRLAKEAEKRGLTSVAVSVEREGDVFTTECEKAELLKSMGVEIMMTVQTKADPEHFVKEVLAETLGAKALIAGENHKELERVRKVAEEQGMEIVVVETEADTEGAVTTERVAEAFENADFEKLTDLCGHPYIIMGEVVHGKALGRTVGMPTANIGTPEHKKKPADGVYATLGHVAGGTYKSLTNIGKRPSVDNHDYITIETFLLDFKQDIYGQPFCLEVHKGIRGVQKFNNLEEVREQVRKDLRKVRDFLDALTEKEE